MPEFSPEVRNRTGRGRERGGRDRQAQSPPGRSQRHVELSQLEREKGRGAVSASFPTTPNSLACFSVNNKNTQWGDVSVKQIHFLPASLARLHGGDSQAPPQPREGESFGRTPSLRAEGWCLPGAAAPVPGEGAGGEARGGEGDKPPFLAVSQPAAKRPGQSGSTSFPLLVFPCSSFSPWATCSWSHACCPAA